MLNTGSARYPIKIIVPPGTAGHAPNLILQYDSGYGAGFSGIGWRYGPGAISRQTDKRLPRYVDGDNTLDDDFDLIIDEPDEVDTILGPDGEELVEVEDNVFRARIERAFVRYRRIGDHWEADLKNGTTLRFGSTPAARITDSDGNRIFKWLLENSTDVNGNSIDYSYISFPGSDNQKYMNEIRYGPGSSPHPVFYFISFKYEERPDWWVDYRSGFAVKTDRRVNGINVGIQGASPAMCAGGDWNDDTIPDSLISRYELTYTMAQPNVSYLSKVTRYGSDGVNYLPPVSFKYSTIDLPQLISATGKTVTAANAPVTVMDSDLVDLVDLNRDGLPDILRTDQTGSSHTCYINLGVNEEAATKEVTWASGQLMESADGMALSLNLAEDRVSFADMDGDGISDLVHTTDFGDVYYYRNTGKLSWDARKRMSVQDFAPPAPFLLDDVETADLDFDKRIDVVQSSDSGFSIWFNIAEGKYSRKVNVTGPRYQGQVIRFSEAGVQTADMNGDRLPDVAKITPTSVIYAASMGYGNFAASVIVPIPDTVLTDGQNSQLSRARLIDVNNDGLADLVVERAGSNELWCWLNRGTDTFTEKYRIMDMPSQFSPQAAVRWADMNGNGTTDLVYADSASSDRIRVIDIGELLAGSGHGNLLTVIKNGLGLTTTITYRSSTNHYLRDWALGDPWQSSVPFPVQVVSEIGTTTGLDLDHIPGTDFYKKEYRYRDGYYEDRERQFRGFAEVRVIEWGDESSPSRVTRNGFFTGGPDGVDNDGDSEVDEVSAQNHREEDGLKGRVRFAELKSATGKIFNREENSWLIRNLLISLSGIEVRLGYNRENDKLIYEGTTSPETVRTTYAYDDYGNIIEKKQFGALSISGDERYSYSEYINETSSWILGAIKHTYQTGADDITIAESRSYYDGPDYVGLGLGSLSRGRLTRQEGWVADSTWIDLLRNAYDGYGNVIGTMNPNGYHRTVLYDTGLQTYPQQETIEIGGSNPDLSLTAAYNLGLGTVSSSLDFNGNEHRFGYDVFGRLTSIVHPGDSEGQPSQSFLYAMTDPDAGLLYSYDEGGGLTLTPAPSGPSSITTKSRETSGQGSTFDTISFVDGMGRSLCRVEEGEVGFIVTDAVLFNALGTISDKYPASPSVTSTYSRPPPTEPSIETFYDAAGREILVNNLPDADQVVTNVVTSYLPLQQSVTDENSHAKVFFTDGLERLIRVEENNGGETYTTLYDYDPLGNLTTLTDAQNNVRGMAYDGLGRRTLLLDPDRGRMAYTYDGAGNLAQTIDNKSQVVNYAYDGANRLLSEDYLDGAGISPDITYHYDTASPDYPGAANTGGKRSWVEDLTGATFFSYDARTNPVWTIKRIDDDGTVHDYQSQVSYDAMNRPSTVTYPDGSSMEYQYNNRSLLESVSGVIEQIDYHPSGRRSSVTYANGLTTTYSYDPRQRLEQMRTDFTAPTNNPIQDLSYNFDGVSNVMSITDNRLLSAGAPENASQSFLYDDLDRLTRAEGTGYGRIDYSYDKIGNMIVKQSPADPDPLHIDDSLVNLGVMAVGGASGTSGRGEKLPGTEPGPHAITATGSGLVFDYDDNGNMIEADGDSYLWDFRDRLAGSSADGTVASYVYDFSGRRVIKKSPGHTVYYISKGFEIRDGEVRKYVFDGPRRVAMVEAAPQAGEGSIQAVSLYPGWNFFSLGVEPDNPAIASLLASLEGNYSQVWTYDPTSGQYHGYVPEESLFDLSEIHAQKVYIIHLQSSAVLTVSGTKTAAPLALETGWNLVPSPVYAPTPPATALAALSGSYDQVWEFDGAVSSWGSYLPTRPEYLNNLEAIRPAAALWIEMNAPGQLVPAPQVEKILFYHTDHLGSSAVVTDMGGAVVERSEFYPFGLQRYHQQNGHTSAYKFTSKERDGETGLDYFEARYYDPVIASFISVDPYEGSPGDQQDENRYAYVRNNPVRAIDPGGTSWVDAIATGLGVMDQVVETDSEKDGEEGEEGQSTLVQGLTRIGFHALSMAIAGDFSNSDKLFELGLIAGSFALEVAQEETGWEELETIGGAGLGAAQMIKGIAEGDVGTAISSGLSAAESTASLFGGEGYVQGAYLTVGNVLDAMNSVYGGTTELIGVEKKWFEPEKDKGKQAKNYWREKTGKDEAYQKLAPHAYDAYEFFGL